MNYHLLGHSGLRVSELCLGTMTFGEEWGWGSSQEVSREIFDKFVAAGGNFLDTADGYTNGSSERIVGEFVKANRERFVIATKYSFNQIQGDPNAGGNHRKNLTQALDGSLRRLDMDYIDLYWVHAWDRLTPIEETMRALDDAVRAGKILYLGASNIPAWMIARANTIAELRGWTPFSAIQVEYNLLERTSERELIPMARSLGLGITAWSPLASGMLSGKYQRGAKKDGRLAQVEFVEYSDSAFDVVDVVKSVAGEVDRSPSQVALAWLRQRFGTIAIVGARKTHQFDDNLGSLTLTLSPEQIAKLDQASAIAIGYPHDFLRRPFVHGFLHGGTWDQIVNKPVTAD